MESDILDLSQAVEFLGVSEKTLIKLLREEHVPARKIGREWRFSKAALIEWLAKGDSAAYINRDELYMVSEDFSGRPAELLSKLRESVKTLKEHDFNIRTLLKELGTDITIPDVATLRVSYKQQRDVEKLEFKIFWGQRDKTRLPGNRKSDSAVHPEIEG